MNKLGSEIAAIGGTIDPDVTVASTVTSDWMSMASFEMAMAFIMAGTLGTNATIDAKLEQATDSSGTGAKDVTGSDITQMTQAATDESDNQAIINCRAEKLDVANGFDHVRLSITVGTATSDLSGILLGLNAAVEPASDNDLASVGEIVTA